jgi:hypothetical protein
MEAKEILKEWLLKMERDGTSNLRELIEISSRAGEQESDKKWGFVLANSVALAEMKGIKLVVDWLVEHKQETHYWNWGDNGKWQAFLKEHGL